MGFLPPPPGSDGTGPKSGRRRRESQSQATEIPRIDEILDMLMKLNKLVAMNFMSTAQASVIQRGLRTVLDVQLKREQGQPQELLSETLAELCRSNPHLLNLLAPFLPDELVDEIMEGFNDEPDDKV
jgi:hypothetical protein